MKKVKESIIARKEILKTVSLFLFLSLTLNFLYFKLAGEQIIPRSFTASLVALFLRLFGLNAEASGTFVLLNGSSIDVIGECTGIFSIIVYCSVIFAYPTSFRNKLVGLEPIRKI
ncbi:hypothetical protein CW713_10475 [Methanophagales archaeon]|nr:MAG: hypothetical protein CW714_09975 [Methanophagales archaeon]RJS77252.1 MAG: hypothetical protein CW713_10475 [Methanophagales archaeon]